MTTCPPLPPDLRLSEHIFAKSFQDHASHWNSIGWNILVAHPLSDIGKRGLLNDARLLSVLRALLPDRAAKHQIGSLAARRFLLIGEAEVAQHSFEHRISKRVSFESLKKLARVVRLRPSVLDRERSSLPRLGLVRSADTR